jgi:5-methylthioadenosine/S-adenosylhomocysteine deaminase
MNPRFLIRGGCVLTLGTRTANLPEADILIEDGRVTEIGRGLRVRDAEVLDASSAIVMPGFVDTHRHVWTTLFRHSDPVGVPGGATHVEAYGRHHEPDDVYAATLIGLLSAVEAGITTVVDWSDIQVDDRYTDAAFQAHADVGLRTVFVPTQPTWLAGGDDGAALRHALDVVPVDGRTTVAAGTGQALSDPERVARQWSLARDLGLRIHAHAGGSAADRGAVAALAGRGLLGGDVTLVHGSNLEDRDLDAIASSGTAVSLAPSSQMARGIGTPPMQQLIDRGVRPGLAVGDELIAPGDVFAQMRIAQSLQHADLFDLKLAGRAGVPNLLNTREVIRYATIDGARVAGLDEVTGSIEVGKQADIIVLRTDRPNIFPINDPIGAVVWGMDPSNVDTVFVGGRPLLRDGVLTADVARARDLALAARQRVGAAAGLVETAGGPR